MKHLLILLTLLPFGLTAQECWQCLSYAERDMQPEVLATCQAVARITQDKQERSVAQFVLARQHMNDGKYEDAIPLLDEVRKSDVQWLAWMATGLKGDCLLDRGKPLDAVALYEEVAKTCGNDYFTPYYLFKAGKVYAAQKKPKQAYIAFKTIKNRYPQFAGQQLMDLYIDPKLDKELSFNEPRTPLKLPASPIGPGYVMGEKADPVALKAATDYIVGQQLSYYQQSGQTMTEEMLSQANEQAWHYYAESVVVRKALSGIGMYTIDASELHAYLFGEFGYPVMPDVAASFTDMNTGQLDKDLLQRFIDEMKSRGDGQWQIIERAVTDQLQFEKYYKLMGQGIFATRWEGEDEYFRMESLIQASVAYQRYSTVDPGQITVSEKELQEYYKQHIAENRYDKPAGKELHIVRIMALPQHEDTLAFFAALESLKNEWKKITDDSLFVVQNAVPGSYRVGLRPDTDPMAMASMTFPASMEKTFATAKEGDVIGPYAEGEIMCLAKINGFNTGLITARHILIGSNKWEDSPEQRREKQQLAEKLLREVDRNNFSVYVDRYSDDPGSKATGGEYHDFLATDMVKSFGDYCATAPIGKIGLVETEFGFHIIEVLNRGKSQYPICSIIRKQLAPNPDSGKRARQMAEALNAQYYSLSADITDPTEKILLFDSLAEASLYSVRNFRVIDIAPVLHGFPEASVDEIFRVLYDKDAAVGKSFITTDGNQAILAVLASTTDGTNIPYSAVHGDMRQQLEDERRAAILKAQTTGITTVKDIAAKWGTTVESRELSLANPSVPILGFQSEVIGTVFREGKPGTLFVLPGNGGVCAIQINELSTPPKQADYEETRSQLQLKAYNLLQTTLRNELRDQLIDNRRLDALGLR